MAALGQVKKSSILYSAGPALTIRTTSATVSVDVSAAGSPGNLDPEGFTPLGIAKWVDRSTGIQAGFPTLTASSRPPSKASPTTRVQIKYVQPVMEVSAGSTGSGLQAAPTVAYQLICNLEFLLPQRCTLAERTTFLSQLASLFATTIDVSGGTGPVPTGSPLPGMVVALDKPF